MGDRYYLDHRLQECPEWQEDVAVVFELFKNLYLSKKNLLPTLSVAQTEEIFIKPALEILGFSYITQVTTRSQGRVQRPDYALFNSKSDRDTALLLNKAWVCFLYQSQGDRALRNIGNVR